MGSWPRFASINDLPILESERKYHWSLGRRPDDQPGLSDLGFQFLRRGRPEPFRTTDYVSLASTQRSSREHGRARLPQKQGAVNTRRRC